MHIARACAPSDCLPLKNVASCSVHDQFERGSQTGITSWLELSGMFFFPYYSINFIFAFIDSISWIFIADMNFGFNFKRFVKSNKIIIEFLIRNNYYFLLSNIYFFQLSNICLKINIKIL